MTNNKPLGEWTLDEVKAECAKRKDCFTNGCCQFFDTGKGYCKVNVNEWEDLTDKPQFTPDEEAALRVLKAAGVEKVVREAYDDDNRSMSASKLDIALYAKLKDAGSYYIPAKMFPSIKPGQEVVL